MLLTLPSGKSRLLILDSLRGLMLVLMAFDHYGGWVQNITKEPLGWVSAAEGFIFLAGLMVGLLYTAKMIADPRLVTQKLFSRTFKIYLTYTLLLLVFWVTVRLSPLYARVWGEDLLPPHFGPGLGTLLGIVTVYYQTSYLGILPLYVMLFLAAPLFLWLFTKGHARAVFVVSTLLYLAQPLGMERYLERLFPDTLYSFFTWNILFLAGLYFGYRVKNGGLRLSFRPRYLVSALVVAALLFASRELFRFGLLGSFDYELKLAFTRAYLSPLRLANFFLLVYLIVGLAQVRPRWLQHRWLEFLGQHSLYVFAWHGLVLYFVWPFMGSVNLELESLVYAASLTIPAWLHRAYRTRQRRQTRDLRPDGGVPSAVPSAVPNAVPNPALNPTSPLPVVISIDAQSALDRT